MSLEKKDVRLKICGEAHQVLVAVADLNEKDIAEIGSQIFEEALLGKVHTAKVLAARMARWGKSGQAREDEGLPGSGPARRKG